MAHTYMGCLYNPDGLEAYPEATSQHKILPSVSAETIVPWKHIKWATGALWPLIVDVATSESFQMLISELNETEKIAFYTIRHPSYCLSTLSFMPSISNWERFSCLISSKVFVSRSYLWTLRDLSLEQVIISLSVPKEKSLIPIEWTEGFSINNS